jgi:Rod binding domain-containing protein
MESITPLNSMAVQSLDLIDPVQRFKATSSGTLDEAARTEAQKIQTAKDFESVLLTAMMDQMKKSVGNWGFEKDSGSNQMQDIFWMHLSQDIGSQGGIGLWQEIYKTMNQTASQATSENTMDIQL